MKETVNVTASLGVFVRVRAGIDIVTRMATWELQALDPVTGIVCQVLIARSHVIHQHINTLMGIQLSKLHIQLNFT